MPEWWQSLLKGIFVKSLRTNTYGKASAVSNIAYTYIDDDYNDMKYSVVHENNQFFMLVLISVPSTVST